MKPKILVVDDSLVMRQAYAFLLQRELQMDICGEAASVAEAMALLPTCNPDLVLMDISLTGATDGIDLLKQLRTWNAALPVLVVSGYDAATYAPHVLEVGASAYVAKGDTTALLEVLRKLTDKEILASQHATGKAPITMPRGQAPIAPSKAASQDELRQLYRDLLRRIEDERTQVAQAIHNELGQSLTAIKMALKGAQRQVNAEQGTGQATLKERLQVAESLLDETIQTVRRIAADLRPGLLDHFGLGAAVEWQMQQFSTYSGRPHHLQVTLDESQVTPAMATVAFRILQEALIILGQSVATGAVTVTLTMNQEALVLSIQEAETTATSNEQRWPDLAVLGLHEQAQQIGGAVGVCPVADGEIVLVVWLPRCGAIEDPS